MSALQRHPTGPVVIGISPGLAMTLAVPLTRAVQEQLPDVRLRFVQAFSPTLHEMLLKGQVDLAVLNGPVPVANLLTYPFLTEGMCLIGPPAHRKARPARIGVRDLAELPLVMTGLAKSGVRLELEAQAAHAGVHLNPVVEVETMEVAKRLIKEKVGVTVHFAATVLEDIEEGRLSAQPIDGLSLRRMLAHPSDRPASRATKAVVDILRQVARELVAKQRWPHATLDF